MTKNLLILGTLLFAAACSGGKGDTGGTDGGTTDGGTDGGTTGDGGTTTSMDCAWGGGGLTVDIFGGDSAGYWLGLAETACGGDCWTGEDCVYGYTTGSGTVYSFCHPMSSTGVYLSTVTSIGAIVEGSSTIHSEALNNTYFMEEVSTGACWVWGHDTSYYGGLGCSDIGGGCSGE